MTASSPVQQPSRSVLVVEGGTLIDGNGGPPVRDASIIIRENRFNVVSAKGGLRIRPTPR